MKKILSIIICLIVTILLTGCENAKEKEFSSNGLTITLTENFHEETLVGYTNYYESSDAIVTVLKEDMETLSQIGFNKDSTLDEYLNAILSNNNREDTEIHESENKKYKYFTYNAEDNDEEYFYMSSVFKGENEFWLISFMCLEEDKGKYKNKFIKWADSVEIQ